MSAERDLGRPVPFLRSARAVFDLTLEGMVWSRRSLLMVVLLAAPAPLALVFRLLLTRFPPRVGSFDFYGIVIAFWFIRNALPLALSTKLNRSPAGRVFPAARYAWSS